MIKRYAAPKPLFSVRVQVPATAANLGAGFDVLGVALNHYNEIELIGWESAVLPPVSIQVDGEGASKLPLDKRNLVYLAARRVLDESGKKVSALQIRLNNRIPLSRGLGSSSAAIVGGIVAANIGCGGKMSTDQMLKIAADMEGHPDNVAPALLGGLCVAAHDPAATRALSFKKKQIFSGLRFVVCIPYFELSTKQAREILPRDVSRAQAVFNIGRAGLFLGAMLERRYDLLSVALEDQLHVPYRKSLIPGYDGVVAAAKEAGAYGATISGAGPSLIALAKTAQADRVGQAMSAAFNKSGIASLWLALEADLQGARAIKSTKK